MYFISTAQDITLQSLYSKHNIIANKRDSVLQTLMSIVKLLISVNLSRPTDIFIYNVNINYPINGNHSCNWEVKTPWII